MKNDRVRLLIVISDLSGGGAERVVSTILQEIDRKRFEPMLALWRDHAVYPVPDDVPVRVLGKYQWWDLFRLVRSTRRLINEWQPDVVYSHLSYVNFLTGLSLVGIGRRPVWMACEHNNPFLSLPPYMRMILRFVYKLPDAVVGVSKGVGRSVMEAFSLPERKVTTIYNPLELPGTDAGKQGPHSAEMKPFNIVAMGRLTRQKDYPTLLRAVSLLRDKAPVKLSILGDGPDRGDLEETAHGLGISDCVEFLGFVKDPFPVIRAADVYVMSSLWEGLPTALIEAMACGVPVVSTRAEFGPEEVIVHGESGLLVDVGDHGALADSIFQILQDRELHGRLSENGVKRVHSLFSKEVQIPCLEKFIIGLLGIKHSTPH